LLWVRREDRKLAQELAALVSPMPTWRMKSRAKNRWT
jgi:hypothetical protein